MSRSSRAVAAGVSAEALNSVKARTWLATSGVEVLQALAAAQGMSWEDVVAEAARKRGERGGFDHRIFLEYVDRVG